jgi:hypothetical protein
VIALTWALYVLLRPVNKDVALLGAWFRIAENAVICALTAQLIVAIGLFRQPEYMSAFDAAQANALGRLFLSANILGYNLAFILLGLGSAVFAYLLFESRYVPRVLAGVGVIGCLVFAIGAAGAVVFPRATQSIQMISWPGMGIYEVGVGAWLFVRGARIG